jgi:hypothetical protein
LIAGQPPTSALPHCGTATEAAEQAGGDVKLQAAFTPPVKSNDDIARERGPGQLEAVVRTIAQKADNIDVLWQRYQAACANKPARRVVDGRDWFGIWAVQVGSSTSESFADAGLIALSGCGSARAEIVSAASFIRLGMLQAEENARRADVNPGTVRDIQRKYGMVWSEWGR